MPARQRPQQAALDGSPPDNLRLRTHLIEQDVPQLSLADLEAVGQAIARRWEELQAAARRLVLERHHSHLRALPAGARLEVIVHHAGRFAHGELVALERSLRPPSTNIRVLDRHGNPYHMPMLWLLSETEDEAMRTALLRAVASHASAALREAVDHRLTQAQAGGA